MKIDGDLGYGCDTKESFKLKVGSAAACMEWSEGEVQDEAGSCYQHGLIAQQVSFARFNFYSLWRRLIESPKWFCLELKTLKIHLLVALKDVCANDFEDDFDQLFRDVEH